MRDLMPPRPLDSNRPCPGYPFLGSAVPRQVSGNRVMASSKTITWAFSLYMFSFAAVMVFAPGPLITSLNAALDLSRPLVDLAPLPLEVRPWIQLSFSSNIIHFIKY